MNWLAATMITVIGVGVVACDVFFVVVVAMLIRDRFASWRNHRRITARSTDPQPLVGMMGS